MDAPQSRLFLVTPPVIAADAALRALARFPGGAAALLISDGPSQAALAGALTKPAQAKGIAVLIEYDAERAIGAGADGVMTGGSLAAFRAARAALPKGAIAGARCATRHQAMEIAEDGADFIAFADPALAAWWRDTIEVPCVSLIPGAEADFIVPDEAMWRDAP